MQVRRRYNIIMLEIRTLGQCSQKLEKDTLLVSEWFSDNFMKLNEEKSNLLIFGAKNDGMTLNIGASQISESVPS